MNIGRICRRQPVTVTPETGLQQAAKLMREKHVGYLVVVMPDQRFTLGKTVGVLTDRDIVISVFAAGIDPGSLVVGDVMNRRPITARETDAVDTCLRTMRNMGVRRLPVTGSEGELLGLVALDDLLDYLASEIDDLSGAIRSERLIESVERP